MCLEEIDNMKIQVPLGVADVYYLSKKNIIATRIVELESKINFVEDLWLQLQTPEGYLYVSLVYITSSPNNTAFTVEYLNHLDEVMRKQFLS